MKVARMYKDNFTRATTGLSSSGLNVDPVAAAVVVVILWQIQRVNRSFDCVSRNDVPSIGVGSTPQHSFHS